MLKYYCDFNELYAFVDLHRNNCTIIHETQNENTKYPENVCSFYTAGFRSQAYRQAYVITNFITRGAISRYTFRNSTCEIYLAT